MARNYNLQDPYDIAMLKADFEGISAAEWKDYIAFVSLDNNWKAFSKQDRDCLNDMERNAGNTYKLSDKRINWGLKLADKIEEMKGQLEKSISTANAIQNDNNHIPVRHVTFRVAWHDNKWNGSLCSNPKKNRYCSGFHSLLSERLRKRKELHFDKEIEFQGKPVSEEYLPPCFWGINIFGENELSVKHDNPAEPRLEWIQEQLPARSLFSWPFAVAFTRDNNQYKIEGSYPKNLEEVRIPTFNSKVQKKRSVAFIYTKFSNPLTEEEQQYLVVGCGLVTGKGKYNYFEPFSLIEEKRKSKPKLQNFPSMNWAIRYSFEDERMLVRMPYHEYMDYADQPAVNAEMRQNYLDKIKVAITEPELEHCFKYVAMDVDDDEAIFILSKMRQRLLDCEHDGIVPIAKMQKKIRAVDEMLEHCWLQRSYFPGFAPISRYLLNWDKPEFLLDQFIKELQDNEGPDYADKFIELLSKPSADITYKKYAAQLREVKSKYEENYGLTDSQFISLCLLNLKPFQFERVLAGKLRLSGDWRRKIEDERRSRNVDEICNNPYLLYEEYDSYPELLDKVTGEVIDSSIELFKIDIAYFPDSRFGIDRLELQYEMKNNDKRRIRALLIRYLRTLENTGHCFADAGEVEAAIRNYPLFYNTGTDYSLPPNFFQKLSSDYITHLEENEDKLKVISENDTTYFYLYEIYRAEEEIEEVVELLLQEADNYEKYDDFDSYLDNSCRELRNKLNGHFEEETFRKDRTTLYKNIYRKKIYVLAGNPGSGKSYELLNIITDLQDKGQKCLVLAPTGKAALRLRSDPNFKNIEAFTIDKFIADIKSGKLSRASIQDFKNLIVDEMSMVDLIKMRDLLRLFNFKIPSFKRLVLVGDPHQLPAIGYGKVLKDIIYYLNTHPKYSDFCIELQTNCRQELAESKILEFAEGYITDGEVSTELKDKIVSGEVEISKGFRVQFWQTEEELIKLIGSEFEYLCENLQINGDKASKLNQLFKLDANGCMLDGEFDLEYFQILSPYKADYFGAGQINELIQAEYKSDLELEIMDGWFKQSDKIIRTKNYYAKNRLILSNGSIGLIRDDGEAMMYFSELDKAMPLYGENGIRSNEQEFFDLAYAITVHKSQGSSFNHTFFVLPNKIGLLSKELVYTALTRSRESVTLLVQGQKGDVFDKSVLEKARSRSYTESRKTSLLLDKPFRYFALEADGQFIESRVELLIYQALKGVQNQLGASNFSFSYEAHPVVEGVVLPMKTDFTIVSNGVIWYWEHLGRIGNKKYEWTWHEVKKVSYQKHNAYDRLLTTHERNGINPDKIQMIIDCIVDGSVDTEDSTHRYSRHHYSLR